MILIVTLTNHEMFGSMLLFLVELSVKDSLLFWFCILSLVMVDRQFHFYTPTSLTITVGTSELSAW